MGQRRKIGDLVKYKKFLQETNAYIFQATTTEERICKKSRKLQTFRTCQVSLINSGFSDSSFCQLRFYPKIKNINEYTGTNDQGENEYVVRKC